MISDGTPRQLSDAEVDRLLAHIQSADTRWFRAAGRLMDFGRHGVPDHRNSRNPIRWLAAETAVAMSDAQTWWTNRRVNLSARRATIRR